MSTDEIQIIQVSTILLFLVVVVFRREKSKMLASSPWVSWLRTGNTQSVSCPLQRELIDESKCKRDVGLGWEDTGLGGQTAKAVRKEAWEECKRKMSGQSMRSHGTITFVSWLIHYCVGGEGENAFFKVTNGETIFPANHICTILPFSQ